VNPKVAGTLRLWARMGVANLALAALIAAVFEGVGWRTPWHRIAESIAVTFVFCICIWPMCFAVMTRLAARASACQASLTSPGFGDPAYWTVLVIAMTGVAAVGSLGALVILSAVGYIRPAQILTAWLTSSLRVSIIVTLMVGISTTVYEMMRERLDQATLVLRTKERDDADARKVAAEAHLASLESRVNPHFLFNTLNSIAALTHDDPAGAERMTNQLASLMRSSLDSASTPLVALEQELRVVRDYLQIEQVRFGERLRFTVDVPVATGAWQVPRLSLQTLVENSVKFAVSPRREGASIAIRAAATDTGLRLEVEDDGPGFDAARPVNGHGLALLKARLAISFNGRGTLHVDSRPGRTCVALDLPAGRLE
jgi:two-component system sensor histidine kinase AlgZ